MCAGINVRLANSIFANHERARLDMKKQDEDISKNYYFFDDHNDEDDDDKNFPDDVSIKQESDFLDNVSIKQDSGNEIDDRETIHYASPKRESDNGIDEKIYKEPKLENAIEIEKQAITNEEKVIKTELYANKVDLETSKETEIKKIEHVFDEAKIEEPLKDIENFFLDNNAIFDHDEIFESDWKFIMDLIDRSNFIADTKKFIKDTEVAKMEIVDPTVKQEMEKKEQDSIDADEKKDEARDENSLMKKVKIKNEFLEEAEKLRKQVGKSYQEKVKKRKGEYYEEKPLKKSSKARKNNLKESKCVPERKIETFKRKTKNRKKPTDVPTHPRDRKKVIERKMAKSNSKATISDTFGFDPEDYLDKSLLFDLKKTSEEKIFDSIIEEIPDNDKHYNREGTNAFHIRKDEKQGEKDELLQFIENLDRKINKSTNKSRISQLKRIKIEALQRYTSLEETFVDINNEKTEILDALLNIDRKLAVQEIEKSKMASATREQNKLIKNIEILVGIMTERKKVFRQLQTDAKSIQFTEETIKEKVLKKLKK